MKELRTAVILLAIMTLLLGLAYPLFVTGTAKLVAGQRADGSLVYRGGSPVGSALIGQGFSRPDYFHGRPSAKDYDGVKSGGSNFGPTNRKYIEQVKKLAERIRAENLLSADAEIPAELVLASGSGLDPHISLRAAVFQVPRISRARGLDRDAIMKLLKKREQKPYLGLWGEPFVNVLELNLALDAANRKP